VSILPPSTYVCIDCGGTAHLITFLPEDDEVEPGTPLAYRCSDCMERFDVIWEEGDGDEEV
jgi:DNA-directed RNA polymerase subunit RPC12/RpoP